MKLASHEIVHRRGAMSYKEASVSTKLIINIVRAYEDAKTGMKENIHSKDTTTIILSPASSPPP